HAANGKYAYVPLTERYAGLKLPEVEVVDLTLQHKQKKMNGPFSYVLLNHIQQALARKEQVILFQNRRGFAPMVECKSCGWVPRCQNCDVSLTFHRELHLLTCHYCGYTYQLPHQCPSCQGEDIVNRGYGTERIENLIQQLFPDVRLARMDLDTTRTRTAYERIIADFQSGKTDILIGTQMVTKGLDFEKVSVVGILDADMMLSYPDFRSYERAFQMMAQVAGRAGRKGHRGKVILQTRNVQVPVINQVVNNDYNALYDTQIIEREKFHYPPFYRMIYIYVKHRKEDVLDRTAKQLALQLQQSLGENRVLGPVRPPVARVQSLFIRRVVIKVEKTASLKALQKYLREVQHAFCTSD
ncbi:MAG: primosomal protein N', partial [Bacteroidaceae bacterium]|nr:primosomal protein N' [Bacteroidaceae bacterium]